MTTNDTSIEYQALARDSFTRAVAARNVGNLFLWEMEMGMARNAARVARLFRDGANAEDVVYHTDAGVAVFKWEIDE